MSVLLVIKSPTQHVEDFKLNCQLTWTIGQVKDEITNMYPSNPKKEHQKLIYGGKLLPDHLSLKSVLIHTQEIHTMHLVVPSAMQTDKPKLPEISNKESFSTPPFNPLYSGINPHLFTSNNLSSSVPAHASAIPPVYSPTDFTYQYMAMQQMYSQFMTQYFSQMSNYGQSPYVPPAIPPQPAADVNQNVVQNERPAPEEDVDYIDYLYVASRFVVMIAILYYHSSLSRIVAVLLLATFISMYIRVTRRYLNQMDQLQQRANNQDATENQPENNEEQSSENTESEASEIPQPELSMQQPGQRFASNVLTVLTIIQSFFTSLIPSEPAPVNAN